MTLTQGRADVLTEVMNLGMGCAANTLNELIGTHIDLRVPGVSMLPAHEAQKRIEGLGWVPLSSVQMEFDGSLRGKVALLFPGDSALKLVSLMTCENEEGQNTLDDLRKATLEEAGNILLNGVIGEISNVLDDEVTFSIPFYSESDQIVERMTTNCSPDAHVILSRARFDVAEYQIEGEILLFFEVRSLEGLFAALDRMLTSAAC